MARTRKKCMVTKKNELRPCSTLQKTIVHNTCQGISIPQLVNLKTGNFSQSYAMVKSGEFKKRGLILNYCPFCGESIAHHIKVNKDEGNNNTKNN